MTRTMKDSGIEWIGEIPEDWDVMKVKQLFNLGRGRVIAKTELLDENSEGYPVYSSQTKNNGILGYISTYDYDIPQLTWTTDGANAGTIFLRTGLYNCTNVCGTLSLKTDNSSLNYLLYILSIVSPHYKRKDTNGYKIMNNEMAEIKLAFPPLSEQEKIASILDEKVARIDSIIADTKQSIEELKKYKQSLITETVTKGLDKDVPMKDSGIEWIGKIPENWEVVKLKRLGKADNGVTYKPHDETDSSRGRLVLRSSNIQNGKLSLQDNVYIDKGVVDNKLLYQNDILICSRNGSKKLIGKNILVTENEKYAFGAFMMRFKPFSGVNARYIQYILHSNIFDFYLGSFLTSTINQLTVSNFYNIIIALPSNPVEQNQIVEFLDTKTAQIDQLIQDKEVLIEQYEKYKKSMIYEYVTGKREI